MVPPYERTATERLNSSSPVQRKVREKLKSRDRLETANAHLTMYEDGNLLVFRESDSSTILFATKTQNERYGRE
ncbi:MULTISPECIES: hypothetical protein [unclassified Streptomyces]|uniref:hypothetical protein n=1 Tax=unclassified Streptomyces TaxID=2593676 RepID=UPI0036F0FB39